MASEVPRLARQLFLRGLAAAFLAAFASLYVQLPGEPAAAEEYKSGEGSALHMPRGALALPGCCAQGKSQVLAGASGEGRVPGEGRGGCVSLSDLAEGPAPKARQPLGRRHRVLRLAAPRAPGAARPPLSPAAPSTCPGQGRARAVAPSLSSALALGGRGEIWRGARVSRPFGQRLKGRHSLLKGVPCPHVPP